jgi:plasmid stabilization system protein ParE
VTFRIEFTDAADMEVQDTFLWLLGRSPEQADRWQAGLEQAVNSLTQFPGRCPLAPESDAFAVPVRQLLYGSYRVLFTLVDSDDDGAPDTVRILHVRHGARRLLSQETEPDDA